MTVVVAWYWQSRDQLWCIADTRLSTYSSTATDSGAKLLPLPVVCYHGEPLQRKRFHTLTFGFAFSGSTLAALNAHALATACTQNLYSRRKAPPPSVQEIAELYREAASYYIRDLSSRQIGSSDSYTKFFFTCFVMGYCPRMRSYQIYQIIPRLDEEQLRVDLGLCTVQPDNYLIFGSGSELFRTIDQRRRLTLSSAKQGVMYTMQELLSTSNRYDVGGFCQVAIVDRRGFRLEPVLDVGPREGQSNDASFLGVDANTITKIPNYRVGLTAVKLGD